MSAMGYHVSDLDASDAIRSWDTMMQFCNYIQNGHATLSVLGLQHGDIIRAGVIIRLIATAKTPLIFFS